MAPEKVAVVTGSTSGIGLTIAERLAGDGFRVLLTGRSTKRGEEAASRIGCGATFFECDLTGEGAAALVVDETVSRCGRIDVLVNNAAVDHTNSLFQVEESEIRETFSTNVFAPMNLLIAAARQMREQGDGGSIINITSRLASIGVPTMGVYSASKGALLAYTTAAAVELARFNIRVNAVAPGLTRTPLYENWISSLENPLEEAERAVSLIPLGRIAETQDVAAVVSFLASPGARYLTGISIPVDGGYLAA
jgi:NAD(P)-dependent dehydrogenase (short-subunit alcohol dehydrogenase family)